MNTQAQVRAAFWNTFSKSTALSVKRRGKRQNDYPAEIRTAWVDFVDCLARDRAISEKLASRVTL